MGNTKSGPVDLGIDEQTAECLLQYNIRPSQVKRMRSIFNRYDTKSTGFWTVAEFKSLLGCFPDAIIIPCLEALIKVGSSTNDSRMSLADFLVSVNSFCALSKEELVQFIFIVVDANRSGTLERAELLTFYSSAVRLTSSAMLPSKPKHVYQINYVKAVEEYSNGEWISIVFDEFSQMCDMHSHLIFPAVLLQDFLRRFILGQSFWEDYAEERLRIFHSESESKVVKYYGKSLITGETVVVPKPGRITMREIFEFTKRNGLKQSEDYQGGGAQGSEDASSDNQMGFTEARDLLLQHTPLLKMIRNTTSPYYVPRVANETASASPADVDPASKGKKMNTKRSVIFGGLDKAADLFN